MMKNSDGSFTKDEGSSLNLVGLFIAKFSSASINSIKSGRP